VSEKKLLILQRIVTSMRLIFVKFGFILTFGLAVSGCETLKNFSFGDSDETEKYVDWKVDDFRQKAKKAMEDENYVKAIEIYQGLESHYPFGTYAAQTQLDLAYAYYKNTDYDDALATVDQFIKMNPQNPHADYAYYLKGLVNFNRNIGFLYRFLPTDSSQRDSGNARETYINFAELVRRFPKSQYAPDAKQRMIALNNRLAMHEIHVAKFYMKRKAYLAAVNRASEVVKNYPTTSSIPYALQIMTKAYLQLGLEELAADSQRVYVANYPNGAPEVKNLNQTFIEKTWDFIGLDKD